MTVGYGWGWITISSFRIIQLADYRERLINDKRQHIVSILLLYCFQKKHQEVSLCMSTESLRTSWNRIQNLLDEFCPGYDEKLIIDKLQLRICNCAWTTQDCICDFISFEVPNKPFLFQILRCKRILKRKWDKSRIKEIIIIVITKGEEHDLTVRSLIRIGLFPAILWRANSSSSFQPSSSSAIPT